MEANPYQVIIDDIKCGLEGNGLTISDETGDRKTSIIYASGKIDGRNIKAVVTYFAWPRIIRVSIELTIIEQLKRHVVCRLINMINNRLCPGHFKINEIGIVTLEAGMFTYEHTSEEGETDYEWPLKDEFQLLIIHLFEAAITYLPLIERQAGSLESTEAIIRSFEKGLKESDKSSLQDIGVELE